MKKICSLVISIASMGVLAQELTADTNAIDIKAINNNDTKVIYGVDDRIEVDQAQAQMQKLAKSTAVMVAKSDASVVTDNQGQEIYKLNDTTLEKGMNVCADQRFASQPSSGMCSGFLVGPNLLVTAGHCMNSSFDCEGNLWVFDFQVDSLTGKTNTNVKSQNVYKCKQIVNFKYGWDIENDYSMIELDRVVENRSPLKVRTEGEIATGEEIVVIGNPSGLPTKVAAGAKVRSNEAEDFFVTNLDTFGGNSGSAVFNENTNLVEGILVRGEKDYVFDAQRGCRVVNECKEDECRGEDVTRITQIKELMFIDDMLLAVRNGDESTVKDILKLGFNPNMNDNNLETALMVAAKMSNTSIAKILMDAGADITKKFAGKKSALEIALNNNNLEFLELAIDKVDMRSAQGVALVEIALKSDASSMVKIAIERGVDLDVVLSSGNLLLGEAIKLGAANSALVLIDAGSAKNQLIDGKNPLLNIAIKNNLDEVSKTLINSAINLNRQSLDTKEAAIHAASRAGNIEVVKLLIEKGVDLKLKNANGENAKMIARSSGHKEIAKLIRRANFQNFISGLTGN